MTARFRWILTLPLWVACASPQQELGPIEPIEPRPPEVDVPIGFLLTDLGNRIERWNKAKLEAADVTDYQRVESLRSDIAYQADKRFEDIVHELETGPPTARTVAATALGFSGRPDALGPLLAALDDNDEVVVSNALVGIGMLAQEDTPLARICYLLRTSDDAWQRNNAAYCLQRLVTAGASDDCVAETCRGSLNDPEAGVRLSAAWILGKLADAESLDRLIQLLADDTPRVVQTSAQSLRRIGQEHDELKGRAARALLAVYANNEGPLGEAVLVEMAKLRGADLGPEVEPWQEWAFGMP